MSDKRLSTLTRFVILLVFILVNLAMFWFLIDGLVVAEEEEKLDASIAALVGALIGAITAGIGIAVRDFFNTANGDG